MEALMAKTLDRRSFMKVTGAAGASVGLTGILQSGQAPAYAQGSKLHIVRWVDFVPASDETLKRILPEASGSRTCVIGFATSCRSAANASSADGRSRCSKSSIVCVSTSPSGWYSGGCSTPRIAAGA